MKPGRASETAVLVCMARAMAHGTTDEPRFSDPTAMALLPDDARARVLRVRSETPESVRDRVLRTHLLPRSKMMVARTVAIDEAIVEAAAPQVVLLGAGLDSRAWRMDALRDATVFEVDHPDTQRDKRARAEALTKFAREIRFVPVDFGHDDLDAALAASGHDPAQPTTWVWEGVVMYLTRGAIDETLRVVARRSALGSRLVVAYIGPGAMRRIVGIVVRLMGEPFRSVFTARQMRALLAGHGFRVASDADIATIAESMTPDVAEGARVVRHLRIAVAERVSSPA